jgi:hypothetical protein
MYIHLRDDIALSHATTSFFSYFTNDHFYFVQNIKKFISSPVCYVGLFNDEDSDYKCTYIKSVGMYLYIV